MKYYVLVFSISVLAISECSWLNKIGSFKSSTIASNLFVANRSLENIEQNELSLFLGAINQIPVQINYEQKSVSTKNTTALYRPGFGVTISHGIEVEQLKRLTPASTLEPVVLVDSLPWPTGNHLANKIPTTINLDSIKSAIDFAFYEPKRRKRKRNTRAVVIIHKGKLIAEEYAEDQGFNSKTRLIGNSMTKSIMNALVGLRVETNHLNINDNSLLKEWSSSEDNRKKITVNHLLQMSSGLEADEVNDAITMVYCKNDMAKFGAQNSLAYTPGEKWYYSSPTSNILSKIVRETFDNDESYWNFPRAALFNKIGMSSAVFETDATGTFIGSTSLWSTPKDWARLGQLYLQDGQWNGEQILPKGWVKYTTTKAPASDGRYGAHFWLNQDFALSKDLPEEIYQIRGLFGQQISIIPSKELVIVRMGWNTKVQHNETDWMEYKYWSHEYACTFVNKVMDAVGE